MIVLAALLIAGWAVSVTVLLRSADRARREHARERQLLTNQVMHLAGRSWLQPPEAVDDDGWKAPEGFAEYVADAEQLIGSGV